MKLQLAIHQIPSVTMQMAALCSTGLFSDSIRMLRHLLYILQFGTSYFERQLSFIQKIVEITKIVSI